MSINKTKLEKIVNEYPHNGVPADTFWMADSLLALRGLVEQLTRRLDEVEGRPVEGRPVDERARLEAIRVRVGGQR